MQRILWIVLVVSISLFGAQAPYEKTFITLVDEKVKDGNITAVSKVSCQKGDCTIEKMVLANRDDVSGEAHTTTIALFNVKNVRNFIEFKDRRGVLKEGEKRDYSVVLKDIQIDGHNLFFDKKKLAKELGEKSELYHYFQKHLDGESHAKYTLTLEKRKGDAVLHDQGSLHTGAFTFAVNSQYTVKGGFEKLDEVAQENPMGMLSYLVINSLEFKINNPKGFLKNLLYLSYKEAMQEATTKEDRMAVNQSFLLEGDKTHSAETFTEKVRTSSREKIQEMAKTDPIFDALINRDGQFEKKLDAVLAGKSREILFRIENPKALPLADFFTLFMGYAMQQKLVSKPEIKVVIK